MIDFIRSSSRTATCTRIDSLGVALFAISRINDTPPNASDPCPSARSAECISCKSGRACQRHAANLSIASWLGSNSKRISIRKALQLFGHQWRDSRRYIEPDVFIELLRQHGLKIVALQFGFRPIDHTDGTFEFRLHKTFNNAGFDRTPQRKQETWIAGFMAQSFIAAGQRRAHDLNLHRAVPVCCSGNKAAVCAKTNRIHRLAEFLAT